MKKQKCFFTWKYGHNKRQGEGSNHGHYGGSLPRDRGWWPQGREREKARERERARRWLWRARARSREEDDESGHSHAQPRGSIAPPHSATSPPVVFPRRCRCHSGGPRNRGPAFRPRFEPARVWWKLWCPRFHLRFPSNGSRRNGNAAGDGVAVAVACRFGGGVGVGYRHSCVCRDLCALVWWERRVWVS